jgi:kinetochore protein Mis12/MTW1
MRLAHYAGLDFSALPPNDEEAAAVDADVAAGSSSSSDRPTVESVTALRRRLQASQKLNVALHREKARNDALLRNLRQVLGVDTTSVKKEEGADTAEQENPEQQQQQKQQSSSSTFGFLSQGRAHLASIGSDTPITTTTQFTLSQLQAMRALSTSLRTLLPDLAASPDDDAKSRESSTGSKTWRRERAEYVEASSRKYLEKSGGLELGHQGRVRDGEYQGEGRALSKGEIEGLEAAVAMLGETSQSSKKKNNNNDDEEAAAPADGEAMDES